MENLKEKAQYRVKRMGRYALTLLKWIAVGTLIGAVGGVVGTLFHLGVDHATELRVHHPWILYLLPVGGLVITAIYRVTKTEGKGTNDIIRSVHFGSHIPFLLVPVIFVSTVITHLCGGSAGREGAALQIGGGIGYKTGRLLRMNEKDLSLATMCGTPTPKSCGCAMHYGFLPDTYVMLPVAESGGVSLEWFRRSCMEADYDKMNKTLAKRGGNDLIFLPYLVGTNAPEFDSRATGVFWGLRQEHDAIDMAGAVMEGVSFVLRKNCEHISAKGVKLERIIATGGGAKSAIWCQMQADITGLPVCIPAEREAACLGAAMVCAVSEGQFENLQAAVEECVGMNAQYEPHPTARLDRKYRQFCALYEAALKINDIE